MMSLRLKAVFWALMLVFAVIVSQFLVPAIRGLFQGSELFLLPMAVFCLLGAVLIILALKEPKLSGQRKKLLVLTGICASGFFVFVFLHNAFYGLAEVASGISILRQGLEVLHAVFFLTALLVCPLGFLVAAGWNIYFFVKDKKS